MSDRRANDLELGVEFLAGSVVVAVSGDLDVLTAAAFAAVMNAMVDGGHQDLVVDMGGVTFIGAAGVSVFASVSLRLSPMDGRITLRSASERVRRVFDITGMSDLVVFAGSKPSAPRDSGAHHGAPTPVAPTSVAAAVTSPIWRRADPARCGPTQA